MKWPKSIEEFWEVNVKYQRELQLLRHVMLDCGLKEEFKWSFPTYTWNKKNIVALGGFKNHYALWFFQGVFLNDESNVLTNAQEGKTKAMRHWKMMKDEDVDLDLVKSYVLEAIDNQKAGKEVKVERNTSYTLDEIFKNYLKENSAVNSAFHSLSKGKQKEYAYYITDAKQEATKRRRLDKIIPMILEGVGLNDRYK